MGIFCGERSLLLRKLKRTEGCEAVQRHRRLTCPCGLPHRGSQNDRLRCACFCFSVTLTD